MGNKNFELYFMPAPIASLASLAGLSTAGMQDSVIIEITGVGLFSFQTPAIVTPDGLNVIQATDLGGVWIRQTLPALKATSSGLIAPSMLATIANNAVLTTNGSGVTNWSTSLTQNTSGNATTATTSANIAAGIANDIPYQTAAGTTSYIAAANNSVLVTSSAGVPSLSTTLPAVTAGSVLVTNPTTSTQTSINTALSNVYTSIHANSSASGTLAADSTSTSGQIVTGAQLVLAAGTYLLSYSAAQTLTTQIADPATAFTATAYIYNTTAAATITGTTFTSFSGFAATGNEIFGGTANATVVATFSVPTTLDVYVQLSAASVGADAYGVNATITAVNLG
jgi:hypothetical protein